MKNFNKRVLISSIVPFLSLFTLTGCGNEGLSFGNYSFKRVHFSVGSNECCAEIQSWHDNEIGCEVKLKDGNVLYLSEGSYILIKEECPICNGGKK